MHNLYVQMFDIVWMDECMDGWMDGCMDGCRQAGTVGRQVYNRIHACMSYECPHRYAHTFMHI